MKKKTTKKKKQKNKNKNKKSVEKIQKKYDVEKDNLKYLQTSLAAFVRAESFVTSSEAFQGGLKN